MTEPIDLDALEAVAKAATEGEWTPYETRQADNFVTAGGGLLNGTVICGPTYEKRNVEFIASFDPPTALALIAALRDEQARASEAVQEMHARELHHFETEKAITDALAIDTHYMHPDARNILTRALNENGETP